MPPIEVGPTRAIGAVSADVARKTPGTSGAAQATASSPAVSAPSPQPTLSKSAALDPGEAPIDADRVASIRKAVENGSYPLVPTRIGDAMIAAGMFLRSGKA